MPRTLRLPGQEELHPQVQAVLDRLIELEHGRQALVDSLWASIPRYVQEDAYSGLAGATQINAQPKTAQLYRATVVVASVATGATGTITLGDAVIPVPAGITVIPGSFLVGSTALRRLDVSASGVCALHIFGEMLPTMGTVH